jgi:hypothetical protein
MPDVYDPDRMFDFSAGDPDFPAEPTPGPAFVAPAPRAVEVAADPDQPVTVNYLGEVAALLADCERIRKHAMRLNRKTGDEEIFNPMLFEKAVARRQSILASAVKLHRDLWNDHAQQEFYRLMVQTIQQESPQTAHRLIAELRKINSPVLEVVERVAI